MRAAIALLACLPLAAPAARAQPAMAAATAIEGFNVLLVLPGGEARHLSALLTVPHGPGQWPAVVIVPDEAGIDERTGRLAELARRAGWIAVETDPEAASPDGSAVPPPLPPRRLADWLRAFGQALADDPRVDPDRIAVVGLGAGGRAALHAAAAASPGRPPGGGERPAFAAHAALYPGCAALAAEGAEPPEGPALVLLPGAAEPEGACAELEGERTLLRRVEGATYAWDLPPGAGINGEVRRWAAAGGGAPAPIRPDPAAATAAERALLRFVRDAFGR
jgi:dienelactone hydrolase